MLWQEDVINQFLQNVWNFLSYSPKFAIILRQGMDGYGQDVWYSDFPPSSHFKFTLHFKRKNCQTFPPGTLNVFYILVIHTDNAQVSFVLIALCQPGGAACWKNHIPPNLSNQKNNITYWTNFLRPSTLLLYKKIIC